MNKIIEWLALGGAVLLVLWIVGVDHTRSMEQCEKTNSRDTCFLALNP